MARGRIYQQKHILKDVNGQPIIGPDGKPKYKLRSENWWISYYDANGKRHYESTGSPKKGEAERLLNLRLGAKEKGEVVGSQIGKITVDDALKAVITKKQTKECRDVERDQGRIDNHLLPYFGASRRLTSITLDSIDAYIVARREAGAANQTIRNELQIVRRAFRLAKKAGKIATVLDIDFDELPPAEPRQGFFEKAEFEACREHLPRHLRGLLTFYYWTGWRASEALKLETRHVNLDAGIVMLDAALSKNKNGRRFDFGPIDELLDVIKAQVQSAEGLSRDTSKIVTALFHHPNGTAITYGEWRTPWEAARKAAGYPTKKVHDFRRTAVRNLSRAGVPDTVAMKLTGHKTRSVFDRYNITSEADLHDATVRLHAHATGKGAATNKAPVKNGARVRQFKKRA
jgi:integrase